VSGWGEHSGEANGYCDLHFPSQDESLARAREGAICDVRVEEIADPVMQGIRYVDKLIDERADGKDPAACLNKPG